MKTILVTIQIDNVKAADLAEIETLIEECLSEFTQKRITYNLQDTFGQPIPPQQPTEQ